MTREQLTLLLTYIHLACEKAVHAAKRDGHIDWSSIDHLVDELAESIEQ